MPGVQHSLRPNFAWGPATAQPPPTIPFVTVGALFSTLDPTFPFFALGYNEGEAATADECATLFLDDQTLTSWSVQLAGAALSGTQTLVFRLVIDGTPDATMTISLAVGDTGGVASGSLAIPAGSLVSIEAIFGGGLAAKGVRGCVFAWDGVPFMVESSRPNVVPASVALMGCANFRDASGGDYEDADSSTGVAGVVHPLPGNVAITGSAIHAESVAVPPLSFDYTVGQGAASFATVLLPSVVQDVTDDTLNGTWPPNTVPSDLNDTMAFVLFPASSGRYQVATRYVPASPYEAYSIIISSLNAGLFSPAPPGSVTAHTILGGDSGIAGSDLVQLRWPNLPGTFQYLVGYAKMSGAGTTIEYALAVNGTNEIVTSTETDNVITGLIYARNDIDTVHVVSGDLVRFTSVVTVDAFGGQALLGCAVGFLPD